MTLIWTDQGFIYWVTKFVFGSELLSSWGWYWPAGNVDRTEWAFTEHLRKCWLASSFSPLAPQDKLLMSGSLGQSQTLAKDRRPSWVQAFLQWQVTSRGHPHLHDPELLPPHSPTPAAYLWGNPVSMKVTRGSQLKSKLILNQRLL